MIPRRRRSVRPTCVARIVLLDPFTVVAQVVNFLILVVALKYVLFDRVVEAMDRREREIRARLDTAAAREQDADRRAHELRRSRGELDDRRERLMADARADVAEQRESMLAEARRDLDERRGHWERALRLEHDHVMRDLDRRMADGIVEVLDRAFTRLAGVDLEQRVVDVAFEWFAQEEVVGREFGDVEWIEVATSFELDDDARCRVRDRLAGLGIGSVPVSFRQDRDLVLGVRLRAADVSVEWSVGDYLERLREMLDAGLPDPVDRDP